MSEALCTHRCPLCGWTGDTDDTCSDCGHGVLPYTVTLHD